MVTRLVKSIVLSVLIPMTALASSDWDRMSWDWDNWYEPTFTQEELDQAIEDAESAKDEIIDQLKNVVLDIPLAEDSLWDSMVWDDDNWFLDVKTLRTQDEVDQIVDDSVAQIEASKDEIIDQKRDEITNLEDDIDHKDIVIEKLNETIGLLPHGDDSLWDVMKWDDDNWFFDVTTLITPTQLDQIVGMSVSEAEALKDAIILQRDTDITDLGNIITMKDQEITNLDATIQVQRTAIGSHWDNMVWNDDNWYIEFDTLTSVADLRQAINNVKSSITQNGIVLIDILHIISSEEDEIDKAILDKDGDGLTDEQEIAIGSNPNSYEINLEAGWNLMSLARIPDDNSTGNILSSTEISDTVWIWDENKFKIATELLPSRGHWVYAKSNANVQVQLQ